MMSSQELLSTYEAMQQLTGEMVRAASCGEWDRLVALEQSCSAHVQQVKEQGGAVALTEAGRQKKIDLIRKILDDDRRIRDLTTPWMAQLSALIHNCATERRLTNAYGA
jgi:flagellar protein FliT